MILIILAFLANVCYSTMYLVDIPLQLTRYVVQYRWALLLKIDRPAISGQNGQAVRLG